MSIKTTPFKIIILLLVGYALSSCSTNSAKAENRKTSDMREIMGTVFSLPADPAWGIMERDTTIVLTSNPKLVVYFNNSPCMPCALRELRHWISTIDRISLLRNERVFVDLLFILHSDKCNEQVRDAIIEQNFSYPVMYDEKGEFEEKNILPRNTLMHAFLLDADNKVIFVGNPLLSPKYEKAFNASLAAFSKK